MRKCAIQTFLQRSNYLTMWIISFIPQTHLYLAFYDEIISLRLFLSLPILYSEQQKKYNIINEDVITRNEANSCNAANDSIPLWIQSFYRICCSCIHWHKPQDLFPRPNNIDIAWPIWLITNDIPLWTLHNFKFIKTHYKNFHIFGETD